MKCALPRALYAIDVDLADDDFGAIERQALELVAKAFAVSMRPHSADRAPDLLFTVSRNGIDPMRRARRSGVVDHDKLHSIAGPPPWRPRRRLFAEAPKRSRQSGPRSPEAARAAQAKRGSEWH